MFDRVTDNIAQRHQRGTAAGALLFASFFLLGIPALVSWIAVANGHALLQFWAIPVVAATPWVLVLGMVLAWVPRLKEQSKQGGAMSGLFPVIGLAAALPISVLVPFLVGPMEGSLTITHPRILWTIALSGLPALCLGALLVVILWRESR